jgi:hypothetical protein
MKNTQKEVQDSILLIADLYGLKANYEKIILNYPLPRIVELIVYEMFLNEFYYYNDDSADHYSAYKMILNYGEELKKYGSVSFK